MTGDQRLRQLCAQSNLLCVSAVDRQEEQAQSLTRADCDLTVDHKATIFVTRHITDVPKVHLGASGAHICWCSACYRGSMGDRSVMMGKLGEMVEMVETSRVAGQGDAGLRHPIVFRLYVPGLACFGQLTTCPPTGVRHCARLSQPEVMRLSGTIGHGEISRPRNTAFTHQRNLACAFLNSYSPCRRLNPIH